MPRLTPWSLHSSNYLFNGLFRFHSLGLVNFNFVSRIPLTECSFGAQAFRLVFPCYFGWRSTALLSSIWLLNQVL
ncbi:hypothetical protein K443DRAFT_330043 [Laccaria amethystina LaAM-08-1]|uniref:Uncharacterized protein n=1 Tax=Laccaria amethystina LaAM-08-1 TaxID=1095629 RepID=A0A0C9XC77_9AGAR|nr:hypothetical protein K443DRAFT_330043 [Laccaria amethystina LaAM-08-1]